jgi:predicted kinase
MKTLVAGPPCGGKSTYAREHAQPDQIICDFDEIVEELGYERYLAPPQAQAKAYELWLERADHAQWLVWTAPKRWQRGRYRGKGGRTIVVMASEAECLARAAQERPAHWQGLIRGWFREYEPSRSGGDTLVWTGKVPTTVQPLRPETPGA